MTKPMPSKRDFVAVDVWDAIYKTQGVEQSIVLESRTKADRSEMAFTIIDGQEVRAGSIQELVLKRSDCISLTLEHALTVVWNGVVKKAVLYEIFMHDKNNSSYPPVKVVLTIDGIRYESSECDSFWEAIFDIRDLTEGADQWRLVTCFHCKFSNQAFSGPVSDRTEWECYRDQPDAFKEVQAKGKFAPNSALHAGDYFVHAFHKCAAWSPR